MVTARCGLLAKAYSVLAIFRGGVDALDFAEIIAAASAVDKRLSGDD
jgi:hypothetical protein